MSQAKTRMAAIAFSFVLSACGGGGDAVADADRTTSTQSSPIQAADATAQTPQSSPENPVQNQALVTMTLAELPYRDPKQLEDFMAMSDTEYQNQLVNDWPSVEVMLHAYIPANVRLYPVPRSFYGPMQSCLQQHGLAACREYMNALISLMRGKQSGS